MDENLESAANAQIITTSWNQKLDQQPEYLSQALLNTVYTPTETVKGVFGANQDLQGLDVSTDDVSSARLSNDGFETIIYELGQLKNHVFVDEHTRRRINDILKTVNSPEMASAVTMTQQKNAVKLMQNALISREIMFTQALTTGKINYQTKQLSVKAQFPMVDDQFIDLTKSNPWGTEKSTATTDIVNAISTMKQLNGTTIAHAIMNQRTFNLLFNSGQITNTLGINLTTNNVAASAEQVNRIFSDATGIDITVYDKGIRSGKFIPDGKVVLIPDGMLGQLAWTDTNEALGNLTQSPFQTSTTNDGITLVVSSESDPSGVKYLIAEDFLPVLEASKNIAVMTVADFSQPKPVTPDNGGSNGSDSNSSSDSTGKASGK